MTESTLEGYCQLYGPAKDPQPQLNSNFYAIDHKQNQSGYSCANHKLIQKGFENSQKLRTNLEDHLDKTNTQNTQHQSFLEKAQDKGEKLLEFFVQNDEENKDSSVFGKKCYRAEQNFQERKEIMAGKSSLFQEGNKSGRQIFEEENQQSNFWFDEFVQGIYHKRQVILRVQRENWKEQKICGRLLDDILNFMCQSDDFNFQHLLKSLLAGYKTLKSGRKLSEDPQNREANLNTKHEEDFSDDDGILPVPNNRSPKPFPEEKLETIKISTNGNISSLDKKSVPSKKIKGEFDQVQLTSSTNLEKTNTFFGYVSSSVKNFIEIITATNNELISPAPKSGFKTSDLQKKLSSRKSTGLKNLGQTCYMNALFQCLYQIGPFRQALCRNQTSLHCSLDESLANLFFTIEKKYFSWEVTEELQKLVKLIYQTRKEFQPGKSGDSCALLRAILEELSIGSSLEHSPSSKMFFGGPLIKTLICQKCKHQKKIQETMQIFQVQDIHFSNEEEGTFFKPLTEKRFCPCNQRQNIFNCSYSATSLPEVLVIKIHDTLDSMTHVKALKRLRLGQSASSEEQENMIEYELIASVLNFNKGENGFHSIALVREEEDNKYCVYDDNYKCGESYSLNYHPQLLFYIRTAVNFDMD